MEYIKVHKKIERVGEHLIKGKKNWLKETTCSHAFLECFKHIKALLKHGKFSWKFCSYNFENIKTFKIYIYFNIYSVHIVIFQIFKK